MYCLMAAVRTVSVVRQVADHIAAFDRIVFAHQAVVALPDTDVPMRVSAWKD